MDNPITFAIANGNQSDTLVKIYFDQNNDKVYQAICNRVYLVRNAIAHSKEGEHLRYEPFRHDKEQKKEMPLIRAIAEEIIINSANQLSIPNGITKKHITMDFDALLSTKHCILYGESI